MAGPQRKIEQNVPKTPSGFNALDVPSKGMLVGIVSGAGGDNPLVCKEEWPCDRMLPPSHSHPQMVHSFFRDVSSRRSKALLLGDSE